MENELKFAVLIDADNISDKYIKIILDETANNGVATYKRIYGDWTSPQLSSWKSVLLDNSMIPMQQYSYTTGKNATDSAMIIDAMDILYSGTVDGFCIASSDSDFTRLAARLRESGMQQKEVREETKPQKDLEKIKHAINSIIEKFSDDDGWIFSGRLGHQLSKRLPDFDVRNFGFSKLTPFIKSLGDYEINKVSDGNSQKQIYFRVKETRREKNSR